MCRASLEQISSEKYFAQTALDDNDFALNLQIKQFEDAWLGQGRTRLPAYFGKLGFANARSEFQRRAALALQEAKRDQTRGPSSTETKALSLLIEVLSSLAPEIKAVFDQGTTHYTVAETQVLLGSLKEGRRYRSREVFLSAEVFVSDFPGAVAVYLHEHAHIIGYDGSRGFTDALTHLIESSLRCRHDLDDISCAG